MANAHERLVLRHVRGLLAAHELERVSDRDLLRRFAQRRDEAAFAALVRRHGPMVLRVCRRVLHNIHDADDAFQAVFFTLARKAGAHGWRESVGPWLHLVAYRAARKLRAATERRARQENCGPHGLPVDPLESVTGRELCAVLDEELSRLPENLRAPLVLCCLEGQTRDEAARRLGWSLATLKRRLAHGRDRLGEQLRKRGFTVPAALAGVLAAELAPAALPAALVQQVVASASAGAIAPTRIGALSHELARNALAKKTQAAMFLLAVCTAIGLGTGFVLTSLPAEDQPRHSQAAAPGASENQPNTENQKPKTDLHGDPLPPGAVARLGTIRFRQGDVIESVSFTPDGKRLLSHNYGGLVLWDAATGKELHRLRAARGSGFEFGLLSLDGKSVVTVEYNERKHFVRFRDCAELKVTREFAVGELHEPCLSPDGKLLAATDRTFASIEVWDISAGKQVRSWKAHEGRAWRTVWHLAFSADSKTLVSGGDDKAIRLWDVATGRMVRELTGSPSPVFRIAPSLDGKLVASLGLNEGKQGGGPWDDHIGLWDIAIGKEVRQLRMEAKNGPRGFAAAAPAFAPDGKTLAALGHDGLLRFWDPATGKEQRQVALDTRAGASMLAFAPDGKTLAVPTNSIRLIDVETGKDRQPPVGHQYGVHAIPLAPDARTVATAGGEGYIQLWDAVTGRPRDRITGHDGMVTAMRVSKDGRALFTTGTDRALRVWDLANGKERLRFNVEQVGLFWLTVSPDGTTVALANPDKSFRLLDVDTGTERQRLPARPELPMDGAFAPDGRTLVIWYGDHTARVWDVPTGRELRHSPFVVDAATVARQPIARPDNRGAFLYTATASADGRLVAYGNREFPYVVIHEIATGKDIRQIGDLSDPCVFSLTFSPDGRMLAWAGYQPVIHLMELATGRERRRFDGHKGLVVSLAFATDGQTLISGSEDTTALVWDLTGKLDAAHGPLDLDAAWQDLVGDDTARAYRAIRMQIASPAKAVASLRTHLQPVAAPDAKRLTSLIADLDSDTFTTRNEAMKELTKLGDVAEPALHNALDKSSSPEARRRIEQLLAKLENLGTKGEPLRLSRAIEVLEHTGTPEARQLLSKLAGGAPGAWQTREAKAALERLARR